MSDTYSYLSTEGIRKLIRTSRNLWKWWENKAENCKKKDAWKGFYEGHACAYGDIVCMLKEELERRVK